jgi:hypothetical protein
VLPRREVRGDTSVPDMPSDAGTQTEASGSRREVKVDVSTVVSSAHPWYYAIGRPFPRVAYVDSRTFLLGVSSGQS